MCCFNLLYLTPSSLQFSFFSFNDTPTTEIYTLSLHDALPIYRNRGIRIPLSSSRASATFPLCERRADLVIASSSGKTDRKSTRLNSSHVSISYAVFCLKKKKKK